MAKETTSIDKIWKKMQELEAGDQIILNKEYRCTLLPCNMFSGTSKSSCSRSYRCSSNANNSLTCSLYALVECYPESKLCFGFIGLQIDIDLVEPCRKSISLYLTDSRDVVKSITVKSFTLDRKAK